MKNMYFQNFNFKFELRKIFIERPDDDILYINDKIFDEADKFERGYKGKNIESLYESFLNYRASLIPLINDDSNNDAFSKEEYLLAKIFLLNKSIKLNAVIKKEHDKYYEYRFEIISLILKYYSDLIMSKEKFSEFSSWFENNFPSHLGGIDSFKNGGYDDLLLEILLLLESYDEKNEEKVEFCDEKTDFPEEVYHDEFQDAEQVKQAITNIINRLLKSNFEGIRKAVTLAYLRNENIDGNDEKIIKYYKDKFSFITHSRIMLNFFRSVDKYAPTKEPIFIQGDTGTGKEIVAKMIVDKSNRRGKPFVIENCGGLPPNLIESRLFGHKKGGFTGADSDRGGIFSIAEGGTVFLDELGDMPMDVQVKLLRVLESGEYYRVGDPTPRKANVRVISATNKDVEKAISNGDFREDLYFRLNMAELYIPSLDEDKYTGQNRSADIPYLCYHYFKMYVEEQDKADWEFLKNKHDITPEYFSLFMLKEWHGNVRGIKRQMWRAFIEIKSMIRSVSTDILPKILENPNKDWELQIGLKDETKKSSIFRNEKYENALRSYITNKYDFTKAKKELGIKDWATVRNHINSAFLAIGHHTKFNLDSFKDVLDDYGIKTDSEDLKKAANESYKNIIECSIEERKKLVYEKADEKDGYVDELLKAFDEMIKAIKSQLK